jgi:lipopolysaccharide/colanic/teichoic acid biosynthesis glycosyltransferase
MRLTAMNGVRRAVNRGVTAFFTAAVIIAITPLFALIAVAIKLSSRGPIVFSQERVGLNGKHFRLHKFRTMTEGAERTGSAITVGRDPRITPVGHVLRRFKLDELPQLVNVLMGEMSLVGPRPELARYVDLYPQAVRNEVLSVVPGITDLASLRYMDENELLGRVPDPERYYVDELIPMKLDLAVAYIRRRSLWLDLRIIAATLTGIFGWRWLPAPWSKVMLDGLPRSEGPKRAGNG